ncbi:MAG: CsbD family protein [Salana multivorans]|nr:CsbD family protein [Salana multivorans]
MGLGDKIENAGQDASGRLKEAAGAVTGNEDLKAEGKLDQVAASAKDAV